MSLYEAHLVKPSCCRICNNSDRPIQNRLKSSDKPTQAYTKKINATTTAKPPQNGIVTNHQLQLITPHNLRTTKAMPSSPNTPMPPLLFELELAISAPHCFWLSSQSQLYELALVML